MCGENEFSEEEKYSWTKVKCNEILTSPFQPKLTLFQQQIHSLPLQTNQQDQHTFLGQTFLGNISWLKDIPEHKVQEAMGWLSKPIRMTNYSIWKHQQHPGRTWKSMHDFAFWKIFPYTASEYHDEDN